MPNSAWRAAGLSFAEIERNGLPSKTSGNRTWPSQTDPHIQAAIHITVVITASIRGATKPADKKAEAIASTPKTAMIAPAPDSSVLISQCNSRLLRKMMAAATRRDHGWARSKARAPTTINVMTSGRRLSKSARCDGDVNTRFTSRHRSCAQFCTAAQASMRFLGANGDGPICRRPSVWRSRKIVSISEISPSALK